jgi:hypothetical protein
MLRICQLPEFPGQAEHNLLMRRLQLLASLIALMALVALPLHHHDGGSDSDCAACQMSRQGAVTPSPPALVPSPALIDWRHDLLVLLGMSSADIPRDHARAPPFFC